MRRYNFPFAYRPKLNLKETMIYSSILRQKIFDYLHGKYKCIYLDPALIVNNKNSAISYLTGDRIISFDNIKNNEILCLNSAQDNYLMIASNSFKNENIATFAPFIKRDASQTNLDSVINWEIDVELSMPINLNMEYFTSLAKQTFLDLLNLANHLELKKIFKVQTKKAFVKDICVVDAQKIENSYRTLSLQEAFKHFCSENNFVIVQHNIKKLRSGKSLEASIPTAQDNSLSCGLYVYDKINGKPIHLINVCKRPSGSTAKSQLNDVNPLELTNELYDKNVFDKKRPSNISLVINFTNLLFYLLDKVHLAEVVKSVWPDEFLDFIKTEKLEIF